MSDSREEKLVQNLAESTLKGAEPADSTNDKLLQKPRKSWLRRGLYLLYILIIAVFTLEISLRISGYADHNIYDPIYKKHANCEQMPYINKSHLQANRGRGNALVYTNNLGLRCAPARVNVGEKQLGEFRIAVLGDSITFGEGVRNYSDTYPAIFENILNSGTLFHISKPELKKSGEQVFPESAWPVCNSSWSKISVLNFGVSAYSVSEMRATFEYRALQTKPDLVLFAIIPDDLDLGRTGEVDRFGYTMNPRMSGFLDKDSELKRHLRSYHTTYFLRDLRYKLTGNHAPGKSTEADFEKSYLHIKRFAALADKKGVEYAIVLLPGPGDYDQLRTRIKKDALNLIDLTAVMSQFTPASYRASKYDGHPNARVHAAIAKMLAQKSAIYIYKAQKRMLGTNIPPQKIEPHED